MHQLKQIPSEAQIKKYLRKIIFGKKVHCPRCKTRQIRKSENRYWCKRCRLPFSLLSHTWLKGMKVSYKTLWAICWCWVKKIPVQQAMEFTGLSEVSVRHWYEAFRLHLPQELTVLEGIVQMDEAFMKGITIMAAKEKSNGDGKRKCMAEVLDIDYPSRQHAWWFLSQYVNPGSDLHTDGAGIYRGIDRWWRVRHKRDIHSKWEFTLTSEIEGFFGNMRTFIRRMYHHTTRSKMPGIVSEFCVRFCHPEIFKSPLNYLEKSLYLVPFA